MFAVLAEAAVKRGEGEVWGKEEAKVEGAGAKRVNWRLGRVEFASTRSADLKLVAACPLALSRGVKN